MQIQFLDLLAPLAILAVVLEIVVSRRRGNGYYQFADSLADVGCGLMQIIVFALLRGAGLLAYVFVYERFRIGELAPGSALTWAVAVLGADLGYYWFHRALHEVGFLWALHLPHHQSEQYNLTVSLRQGSFEALFDWIFFLPLALIGLPPKLLLVGASVVIVYQFWLHTRYIGRLGPLEWVMCTPSNHRVHHGRDAKYLGRNYGATFIVWDRLFGTFQDEEEEPDYGTVQPFLSYSPLRAHLHYFGHLVRVTRRTQGLRAKLRLWFGPPGWLPPECADLAADASPPPGEDPLRGASPATIAAVLLHFGAVAAVGLAVVAGVESLSLPLLLLALAYVLSGLGSWEGLARRAPAVWRLELVRHGLAAAALGWLAARELPARGVDPALAWTPGLAYGVVFLAVLLALRPGGRPPAPAAELGRRAAP
ncbi:MAG: sterol desaturase family protein [Planctomycetota bacterium]